MKNIFILIVFSIIGIFSASAQTFYSSSSDIYGLEKESQNEIKRISYSLELGISKNCADILIRSQRNFNKYISWDIFSMKYAKTFDVEKSFIDEIGTIYRFSFTTGVRAFTPQIKKSNVKFFIAYDLGLSTTHGRYYGYKGYHEDFDYFAPDFHYSSNLNIGAFLLKKLYISYGLEGLQGPYSYKINSFRIGYTF